MADERLSEAEIDQLDRDGFLVGPAAFTSSELDRIAAACEATIDGLDTTGERTAAGPPPVLLRR